MSAQAISHSMHGSIGGITSIAQQALLATYQARQHAAADGELSAAQARGDRLARTVAELQRQLAARDADIEALETEAFELQVENRAMARRLGLA